MCRDQQHEINVRAGVAQWQSERLLAYKLRE